MVKRLRRREVKNHASLVPRMTDKLQEATVVSRQVTPNPRYRLLFPLLLCSFAGLDIRELPRHREGTFETLQQT